MASQDFFYSSVSLCLITVLVAGQERVAAAPAKVLEDVPGKLVLEVVVPAFNLQEAIGAAGKRVTCDGCSGGDRPGAPDLPVYRFDALSGSNTPKASIHILESEVRIVPEGLAPFPFWTSPDRKEYHLDPELYRAAGAPMARISGLRMLRGAPIRSLEVPLALWSEDGKSLTLIKRLQVEVVFDGVLGRPVSRRLEAPFNSEVKNPIGGAYLYALPASPLRKTGAGKVSVGNTLIKIKVGDRNLANLDEDRVYGFSFADLERVSTQVTAVRVTDMRLYSGPNDTLTRTMNNTVIPGTLREIPMEVLDNNHNGTFDSGDSVRFFAHGTSIWKRLPENAGPIRFEFSADPYSFENFYYLDFSGSGTNGAALRLETSPSLPASAAPLTSSYAYVRAEKDQQSGACDISTESQLDPETGTDWYWLWKGKCSGDPGTSLTLTRSALSGVETDSLPFLDQSRDQGRAGDSIYLGFYLAGSETGGGFTPYMGGNGEALSPLPGHASPGEYFVWTGSVRNPTVPPLDSLVWRNGNRFAGFTLAYRRRHVYAGKPIWIFPAGFGKAITYGVQGGEGLTCLRIEAGVAMRKFMLDDQGRFTDSLDQNADARYFIYKNAAMLSDDNKGATLSEGRIESIGLPAVGTAIRDLESGDGQDPEYLIITPASLLDQALKLKDYRNDKGRAVSLRTSVVLVEDIYRQFSGGRMSPVAIRDFLRWAGNGWGGSAAGARALQYVLLLGDGHYDYRNIKASQKASAPPNLIPPFEYHRRFSTEEVASDDFYAALDSADNDLQRPALDLAVGRLPVESPTQVEDYLQKIKAYEDPAKAGEWRGRIAIAADDGTQRGNTDNLDPIHEGHTTFSDSIGKLISRNEPGVAVGKVYLLDYPVNSSFNKPEATQDLLSLINQGTLLVNYIGHGAVDQWADEVLLKTNDALARMHNEGMTPMINAFSCTVGRFESLNTQGMSEEFVRHKGTGAIAAISSTRESLPIPNVALANAFYARAFPADSSGSTLTVGQALQEAKNSAEAGGDRGNNAKYALLGEPVLLLRKPHLGVSILNSPDTLRALDCGAISGRIAGGSGKGFVNLKIVAGSIHKVYVQKVIHDQFVDKRGNILFDRTVPFKDFAFSAEYFIPKQISFGDSTAQIQMFAWDGEQEKEGTAAKQNLRIHGTANSCAPDRDGLGPHIRITGCKAPETGNVDFPDQVRLSLPYCLQIQVEDSSGGVMTAEGPDEGTTLEIPGSLDPFHPQPGKDELYSKTYQLSLTTANIKPGVHLLKVSARDGYGNLGSRQLRMELTTDSSLNLVSAYNVPNPMKRSGTVFYFSTILPAEDAGYSSTGAATDRLETEIRIFNQSGKLVREFTRAQSGATAWDGHDEWGQLLANGVYFYTVIARQNLESLGGTPPAYRTLSSKRNVLVISR